MKFFLQFVTFTFSIVFENLTFWQTMNPHLILFGHVRKVNEIFVEFRINKASDNAVNA